MKLQYGKRYVTKSGWITPPMFMNTPDEDFPFYAGSPDLTCGIGQHSWDVDGKYFSSASDKADIVSVFGVPDPGETDITDDDVLTVMESLGGSFVSGLAHLYRKADSKNRWKLKATFSDYWNEYVQHARIIKNRGV